MQRRLILSLVPALALFVASCSDDVPNEFDAGSAADSSGTATDTGTPSDLPETGGESMTTATETGDGDGDPTTGDGDGDPAGDGDGEPAGPECGNGIVELGEQCDGDDLDGNSCESLGYVGGDLMCDPVMCTYDASMCETDMGTGGGTTG